MALTLLQKAKNAKPRKVSMRITDEHIELAISWAKGEISISQVSAAIGKKQDMCYNFIAMALRECYSRTKK